MFFTILKSALFCGYPLLTYMRVDNEQILAARERYSRYLPEQRLTSLKLSLLYWSEPVVNPVFFFAFCKTAVNGQWKYAWKRFFSLTKLSLFNFRTWYITFTTQLLIT